MFETTGKERSPLEALSLSRFGGRTFLVHTVIALAGSPVQLVPNNPNRVFLQIANVGAVDVRFAISDPNDITNGLLLMAHSGVFTMTWEDDGEVVGYEVWGLNMGLGTTVLIYEVWRQ